MSRAHDQQSPEGLSEATSGPAVTLEDLFNWVEKNREIRTFLRQDLDEDEVVELIMPSPPIARCCKNFSSRRSSVDGVRAGQFFEV